MTRKTFPKPSHIGIQKAMAIMGGKWRAVILYHLMDGEKRFNELRERIPSITQRMLTLALKDLVDAGVVDRKEFEDKKKHVEYRLTEMGESMEEIITMIQTWGEMNWLFDENEDE